MVGPKTNLWGKISEQESEEPVDWEMEVCSLASDHWGDLRQGTKFWGLPVISRVSSQGLKKDSPILECIYLSLFCVDPSIHLHLKTNSWAQHQCLSEHSIATQLFARCPMPLVVPTPHHSSNNPTQNGQKEPHT